MTLSDAEILDDLQGWLRSSWDPELTVGAWWKQLADSGWSQPHWPTEWYGKGLPRAAAGAITRAIRAYGAVTAPVGFATGMAGPTLLTHATPDQLARHLPGMVYGTDAYCQLFSEPNAGSDLAGLQCRAERDGDRWVVNGQKVWTTSGQIANKAILVARTNVDVPKHAGISFFIIDVRQPGVEIRPLREMTGRSYFNEVFLTDAVVPDADLIGGEGNGWAVANTTLAFERALSGEGGGGATADPGPIAGNLERPAGLFARPGPVEAAEGRSQWSRLANLRRALTASPDDDRGALLRQDLVRLYALERLNVMTAERARALERSGSELPGLPNLAKMAQNHAFRLGRDVTFSVLKAAGTLYDYEDGDALHEATGIDGLGELVESGLFAQGPPIYGGSDQIQRNIVGDRVLGLPREPSADRGVAFRDLPKN
jgi:alkylation response protein AidB-like acyl-CoA dehydrogenase